MLLIIRFAMWIRQVIPCAAYSSKLRVRLVPPPSVWPWELSVPSGLSSALAGSFSHALEL